MYYIFDYETLTKQEHNKTTLIVLGVIMGIGAFAAIVGLI